MEQRQGVIEEILSTEKVYLDDVQALIRVRCNRSITFHSFTDPYLGF